MRRQPSASTTSGAESTPRSVSTEIAPSPLTAAARPFTFAVSKRASHWSQSSSQSVR